MKGLEEEPKIVRRIREHLGLWQRALRSARAAPDRAHGFSYFFETVMQVVKHGGNDD